jgi:hypothetical protein
LLHTATHNLVRTNTCQLLMLPQCAAGISIASSEVSSGKGAEPPRQRRHGPNPVAVFGAIDA